MITDNARPSTLGLGFCVLAALSLPRSARAETPATPLRLEVAQDSVCGDPQTIASRLAARGVVVAPGAPGKGDAVADVHVLSKDGQIEGSLVLSRSTGKTSRIVAATTCAEVLDALAFTLALALEDDLEPAPPPPAPSPAAAAGSTPPSPERAALRPGPAAVLEVGAGAGAGAVTVASPGASPSASAWAMLGARGSTWFSPAAIVAVVFGLPVDEQAGSNRATSAFQAGMLDVCPARLGVPALGLRPCVRGMLGRLQVRSEGFSGAQLDERVFATVGVAARGEVGIAGPLLFYLDLGVGVPLERATYFIADVDVFETPAVVLSASAGAGVRFR